MDDGGGTGEKPDDTADTEGETPVTDLEEETPVVNVEGETPVVNLEGKTPVFSVEGETPEVTEEPARGGLQTVVVVTNETEDEETPIDERLIRRCTRRMSILDEVDETTGLEELTMGGQGERADIEERRLAAERKRKGKQEAQILPKKSKKATTESTTIVMSDAIKVPFTSSLEDQANDSEWEEDEPEQEEEPNFMRTEVGLQRNYWSPWRSSMTPRGYKPIRKGAPVGS